MIDYKKITEKLYELDVFAVSKIAIYYELQSQIEAERLSNEEIDLLVDMVHACYMNTKVETATASGMARAMLSLVADGRTLWSLLEMTPNVLGYLLEDKIS